MAAKILITTISKNLANSVKSFNTIVRNMSSSSTNLNLKTLSVTSPKPFVFHVELNRPDKYNAFNNDMWLEIKTCFEALSTNPDCRVIMLSGAGKHFTAGIDLHSLMSLGQQLAEIEDVGRKGHLLSNFIKSYQDSISSLEICPKPVITAIHSACIGAGVNLITAADIRYCSSDAWFQVKEIDIGLAADVGALQRLPKVIGNQSLVRELCFTGRKVDSKEAENCGLVNKVFDKRENLLNGALELAEVIASKSPIAMQAIKRNIVYSLDHTNQEGLDHIREINKLNLLSEDFLNAVSGQLSKSTPTFSKL